MRKMRVGRLTSALVAVLVGLTGAIAISTPAHAAWGPQLSVNLQTYVNGQQVGAANGWIQLDTDADTFRYEITACRQSGYTLPYLNVEVNAGYHGGSYYGTHITTLYPPYGSATGTGSCYGAAGTVSGTHYYANYSNVRINLIGATFVGSQITYDEHDRVVW